MIILLVFVILLCVCVFKYVCSNEVLGRAGKRKCSACVCAGMLKREQEKVWCICVLVSERQKERMEDISFFRFI